MSTAVIAASPTPWYRQFWPWLLILLPGSTVVASLITIYLASKHADDLVVDEYYKSGLAINQELTRQQRARELNLAASLRAGDGELTLRLSGDVDLPQLRLMLSHPMEAERDINLALSRVDRGYYHTRLPQPISGRWHWIIDAGDGSPWRLDGDQSF